MLTVSVGLTTPLDLSPLAQLALGFVVLDFFDYAFHRLKHHWRWLWLLHAVHHSDLQVDASTGVRFHPVEVAVETTLKVLLLLALGIPLWVEGARAVVLNPFIFFQHANLAYPPWLENAIGGVVVNPSTHRLHHSPDPRETNSNYGTIFLLWDRLFGTYVAPSGPRPEQYGLAPLADERWQSLLGMLTTPLRARSLATR
jgi:sterol desaturase/sphingolipid hydroxylase (fatty acid hydroxylase superfamily)